MTEIWLTPGRAYKTRSTNQIVDILDYVRDPANSAYGRLIGHFRKGGRAHWHPTGEFVEPGKTNIHDLVEETG